MNININNNTENEDDIKIENVQEKEFLSKKRDTSKDENIQKGYINGRYGAIPFIRDIDLWLEDN